MQKLIHPIRASRSVLGSPVKYALFAICLLSAMAAATICHAARTPLGVYEGPGAGGTAQLPTFSNWFGRVPDRALDFFANDSWSSMESDAAWTCYSWHPPGSAAVVPAMTFSVPLTVNGTSLADVAAGLHDSSFLAVANSLVKYQWGSSVIRLGWEFNGSWMPWAAGADPVSYVAAFRHVVELMRSVPGANFTFDWCTAWGPAQTAPDSVYPGDDVVDIIGMDVYDRYYDQADADPVHRWNTYLTTGFGLNWLVSFSQAHGKPISIPEWGTGQDTAGDGGTGGGDNPLFVTNMASFMAANNAAYSNYWDINASGYDAIVSDGEHPNAGAALKLAFASIVLPPGPIPTISAGNASTATSVSFSFSAPYTGGAVESYVLQYRITGQSTWTNYGTVTWIGWQTLTGLTPGTSYDVQVYAANAGGNGAPSSVFTVATRPGASAAPVIAPVTVPVTPPAAATGALPAVPGPIPTIGSGDVSTAASVSFSFAAPYSGGPVAYYGIQYRITGQSAWTNYGTVTWIGWQSLTGLTPGTSYDVQVYAANAGGTGTPSSVFTVATLSPPDVPGPIPSIGSGDRSTDTSVSFSFAAPYSGTAVQSYVIQYRVTGQSAWTNYGSVTWIGWQYLTGLTPGTSYDVQVYATNANGNGLPSSVFTVATTAP